MSWWKMEKHVLSKYDSEVYEVVEQGPQGWCGISEAAVM